MLKNNLIWFQHVTE